MLAGAWILVLLPLMDVLQTSGLASSVRVPNVFGLPGGVGTLNDTFLFTWQLYQRVAFCIGVVLLFSKERDRRRDHSGLDASLGHHL
jgi:dethiobiotin synthetase